MSSLIAKPTMLTIKFPDGQSFQCVRVDGGQDHGEPAAHHDITLRSLWKDYSDGKPRSYGIGITSLVMDDINTSDDNAPFIPPRPLPGKVFVKWAEKGDACRAAGLAREANDTVTMLQDNDLLKEFKPKFYGHYVCLDNDNATVSPFAISVFQIRRRGFRD